MTIESLLERLDGVRRSGGGFVAICPAHDDHTPSLNIREGERGLLVKCWAGCTLENICEALGIQTRDLFYDANGPVDRQVIRRYQVRRQVSRAWQRAWGRQADALREADAVIRAATDVSIAGWTEDQLNVAMDAVCDARALLEEEQHAGYTIA
jgi:hypothetical protein